MNDRHFGHAGAARARAPALQQAGARQAAMALGDPADVAGPVEALKKRRRLRQQAADLSSPYFRRVRA